jgi:radical SAM-linked protein
MTSREAIAAWESGLGGCGLPLAGLDLPAPRPRIVFAAPLPTGLAADRELLDLFLVARWPVAGVREAVASVLPPGHELVALHDVWLGEPPLSGQVAAADYRVRVASGDERPLDLAILGAAGAELIAAKALPRTREKGGRDIAYDLRPLLDHVTPVGIGPDGLATIRIRTRFDPERGVGRPEEVVAAIAELAGFRLEVHDMVRERLLLIGEA